VSAVADLLKKFIIMERDDKHSKPEATSELKEKTKKKQTAGRGIVKTLMRRKL
jgi:hypothetical protein